MIKQIAAFNSIRLVFVKLVFWHFKILTTPRPNQVTPGYDNISSKRRWLTMEDIYGLKKPALLVSKFDNYFQLQIVFRSNFLIPAT